jgi:hypothetical protein
MRRVADSAGSRRGSRFGELLKDSPCRERENFVKKQTGIYFTVPKGLFKCLKKRLLNVFVATPRFVKSKASDSIFDYQYLREFEAKQCETCIGNVHYRDKCFDNLNLRRTWGLCLEYHNSGNFRIFSGQ